MPGEMDKSVWSGNDWAVGANIQRVAHPEKPGWGSGVAMVAADLEPQRIWMTLKFL